VLCIKGGEVTFRAMTHGYLRVHREGPRLSASAIGRRASLLCSIWSCSLSAWRGRCWPGIEAINSQSVRLCLMRAHQGLTPTPPPANALAGWPLSDLYSFDPGTMTWTLLSGTKGQRPTARSNHGFTSVGGKLYVHGGVSLGRNAPPPPAANVLPINTHAHITHATPTPPSPSE
jgi:hypothetical protein